MGKYWFHFRKVKKNILLFFTFKVILYLKNMFRAKKNFRLSRGVAAAAAVGDRICHVDFSVNLRDRELKFWTQLWFGLKLFMPFLEF
jgi:hypothetical protein